MVNGDFTYLFLSVRNSNRAVCDDGDMDVCMNTHSRVCVCVFTSGSCTVSPADRLRLDQVLAALRF